MSKTRAMPGYQAGRNRRKDVLIVIADYNVNPLADIGVGFSNYGASGAVEVALGPAVVGRRHTFLVETAQVLRPTIESDEKMTIPGAAGAAGTLGATGKGIQADAAGESVTVVCNVNKIWAVEESKGTWTAEA